MTHKFLSLLAFYVCVFSAWLPLFWSYHIHNLFANRTTNEKAKLSELNYGIRNQLIFLQSLKKKTEKTSVQSDEGFPRLKIDGEELS
jgi:hypothetical protein